MRLCLCEWVIYILIKEYINNLSYLLLRRKTLLGLEIPTVSCSVKAGIVPENALDSSVTCMST